MRIHLSSSIANFHSKLRAKFPFKKLRWYHIFSPGLFVGLYHIGDYLRFLFHLGNKQVIWCGTDILNLEQTIFSSLIAKTPAYHICENKVEQQLLSQLGIQAEIRPFLFDDASKFTPCFKPSSTPHVFLTAHPGREGEYGIPIIRKIAPLLPDIRFHIYGIDGQNTENIMYHGLVSEDQFNDEIRHYQSCLRLNTFDGFGEGVAKSLLLAQYPITAISYPLVAYAPTAKDLIIHLKRLKYKDKPNPAYKYWSQVL